MTGPSKFTLLKNDLAKEFLSAFDMSSFQSFNPQDKKSYAITECDDKIAAIAPVYISKHGVTISIIEVHPDFRGLNLGLEMMRKLFLHTRELTQEGLTAPVLSTQGFTDSGKKYILPKMAALEAEFPDIEFLTFPSA